MIAEVVVAHLLDRLANERSEARGSTQLRSILCERVVTLQDLLKAVAILLAHCKRTSLTLSVLLTRREGALYDTVEGEEPLVAARGIAETVNR